MDVHTKAQRSHNMSRVKSTNTKPERLMFKLLDKEGLKYKKHYRITGKPDIVFEKQRVAVFVDGEFWHGRNYKSENIKWSPFWQKKIRRNIERDRLVDQELKSEGWKILRFWDTDIELRPSFCLNKTMKSLQVSENEAGCIYRSTCRIIRAMSRLTNYAKQLGTVSRRLQVMFENNGGSLTVKEKKEVIDLFVRINEIKKKLTSIIFGKGGKSSSARDRILDYLKGNVGRVITGRELAEVGGISEYARRIRELRHECGGWQISTGMNRAGLRPDEYILESLEQKPAYERMNAKIWAKVLERDGFTCQKCGWRKGDPQTNRRRFLEVHHKHPVRAKGIPKMSNLSTLCNVCHDASQ